MNLCPDCGCDIPAEAAKYDVELRSGAVIACPGCAVALVLGDEPFCAKADLDKIPLRNRNLVERDQENIRAYLRRKKLAEELGEEDAS